MNKVFWPMQDTDQTQTAQPIERHPFEPFLPEGATLLMLGTFPPAPKRWSMPFFYPNFMNDMWRIFGLLFFGNKNHFVLSDQKTFRLDALKAFLQETGVALFDTALRVRRTKNTASDKDLEIIEPADLDGLLRALPHCKGVLTAGQLATSIFTRHYGVPEPPMGQYSEFGFEGRTIRLYRMPSSSRAYPMKLENKARSYRVMFEDILGLPAE